MSGKQILSSSLLGCISLSHASRSTLSDRLNPLLLGEVLLVRMTRRLNIAHPVTEGYVFHGEKRFYWIFRLHPRFLVFNRKIVDLIDYFKTSKTAIPTAFHR